jgi:hypothetical protein
MSAGEHFSNREALSCLAQLTGHGTDLSLIDPGHRLVRENAALRARVLEDRYRSIFIEDALETGHCLRGDGGRFLFRTTEAGASFVGLMLEAYVVRCINSNMRQVGRLAIQWCSLRANRPKDSFVDKFFAIGTGLKKTRENFPFFYAPQSGVDVMFLRPVRLTEISAITHEPLTLMGTDVAAGIQIKAVQGNEMAEIIQPMLANKYLSVLTLLTRPDGKHSADICLDLVKRLASERSITELQRRHLERGICRPEEIGLDQQEIKWYAEYARACFEGRVPLDEVGQSVIALEVKNWKYGQAGVLLPGSELQSLL